MEMQRRNGGGNYTNQALDRMESPSVSKVFSNGSSSSSSSLKNPVSDSLSSGGLGYIEHTVTKFDTLAGVAIKYGVEPLRSLALSMTFLAIQNDLQWNERLCEHEND